MSDAGEMHAWDEWDRNQHLLVILIEDDAFVSFSVECPYGGADRPCASWMQNEPDEKCTCECEACLGFNHEDCDSDYVEEIGRKNCQAKPMNECWYRHAVAEVGREMLDFGRNKFTIKVPVKLSGGGWEQSIEVELA